MGPKRFEDPGLYLQPFVDAVVGADAEAVVVDVFRALLEAKPERLTELRNVWTHRTGAHAPAERQPSPVPELPPLRYESLVPLFVGDPEATVPMLMNWGCPYHCSYCSNRVTYSRFTPGSVDRLLGEMDVVVRTWRTLHDGSAPGLSMQLSDATTNALPAQLDSLLESVVERLPGWGMRPHIRGQTLFDARLDARRARLFRDAGFDNTFFGLDGASDVLRRSLNRPAKVADVQRAVQCYLESGATGLTFGVPVGLPGETDSDFERSVEFVEWILSLGAPLESITVLPYVFFRSAQDPALVRLNHGAARGVLWRANVPGGDPAVRARRFMRLFDVIDGRASAMSPIPPWLALPAMLPDADAAELERWMDRHGRAFDQISPREKPGAVAPADGPTERVAEATWRRAESMLTRNLGERWLLESMDRDSQTLVAVYRTTDGAARIALHLEPRDSTRRLFAMTDDFNVSYMREWRGLPCVLDEEWMAMRVAELENE